MKCPLLHGNIQKEKDTNTEKSIHYDFVRFGEYAIGWADKEWSSTNHKYNKHRPSSRLTKGIAKYFLVFEMSLGSNSKVLILIIFKFKFPAQGK